jgi:hypothetical protein
MNTRSQIKSGQIFVARGGFVKTRPIVSLALVAAALLCFIGVAHSFGNDRERAAAAQGEHSAGVSEAAVEKFCTVYHGNDYDAIPEVQHELETAIQLDPNNPTLYALLGATHFWHFGEFRRDPKPDQNVLAQDMPTATGLFQKALDLDYYSQHSIGYINDDPLPGYLGITTVHTGQEYRDSGLIARGDKLLDFAVYQFSGIQQFQSLGGLQHRSKRQCNLQEGPRLAVAGHRYVHRNAD